MDFLVLLDTLNSYRFLKRNKKKSENCLSGFIFYFLSVLPGSVQ